MGADQFQQQRLSCLLAKEIPGDGDRRGGCLLNGWHKQTSSSRIVHRMRVTETVCLSVRHILSLVVSCGWDADVNEYNVYLYDIVSGQQLTTADLLKALDVDETVFLEAVRRAAAAKFDTQYGAIAGGDTDEFLTERRDWTQSDENINMDVRTYADGDGKLHVVLPIGSIAGADSYEQVLSLDDIGE